MGCGQVRHRTRRSEGGKRERQDDTVINTTSPTLPTRRRLLAEAHLGKCAVGNGWHSRTHLEAGRLGDIPVVCTVRYCTGGHNAGVCKQRGRVC